MFSKMLFGPDLSTWALFIELLLAASVVILAGARFTRLADTVAERLNVGSGWIGLILLATVTSLPELVTGGTATWIGNVNLALGNIFGSCSFNITLIVLLNVLAKNGRDARTTWGGGSVLRGVSTLHALTSSFGLLLIGLALLGLVLLDKFAATPTIAQVTEFAWVLLILITYLTCMCLTYRHERTRKGESEQTERTEIVGTTVWVQVTLTAIVLVAASWWLARIGDVLSVHKIEMIGRPLGATFVGACFLALATSLPEIVTSISAVRLGNLDLALGNIFGSNMFNIFVIPWLKVVSLARGDTLLIGTQVFDGTDNLIAGLLAIVLTAIAIGGLAYQSKRKLMGRFGFDSILIAVTYVGGMVLLLMRP